MTIFQNFLYILLCNSRRCRTQSSGARSCVCCTFGRPGRASRQCCPTTEPWHTACNMGQPTAARGRGVLFLTPKWDSAQERWAPELAAYRDRTRRTRTGTRGELAGATARLAAMRMPRRGTGEARSPKLRASAKAPVPFAKVWWASRMNHQRPPLQSLMRVRSDPTPRSTMTKTTAPLQIRPLEGAPARNWEEKGENYSTSDR